MTRRDYVVWMIATFIVSLAIWNYAYAQGGRDRPERGPFKVLVKQDGVTLFEHDPTKTCFVAWQPGGLVQVDPSLCKGPGFPIVIPIPIPPGGGPISPEK